VVCIGKGRKKKEVKMWGNARNYAPCGANFEKVHGASPWRAMGEGKKRNPQKERRGGARYKYPNLGGKKNGKRRGF